MSHFVSIIILVLCLTSGVLILARKQQQQNDNCLACRGFHDKVCINYMPSGSPVGNGRHICATLVRQLTKDMQVSFGNSFANQTLSARDIKCLYYEKQMHGETSDVYRGCVSEWISSGFCDNLLANETIGGYTLRKCILCTRLCYPVENYGDHQQYGPNYIERNYAGYESIYPENTYNYAQNVFATYSFVTSVFTIGVVRFLY